MLVSENRRLLHEENHAARRHLGFQVVTLYMVSSSVPLVAYASIEGSFIVFDNRRVTIKLAYLNLK